MKVVIDIEANALVNPTKIWCIVCKDVDTGEYYIFRNLLDACEHTRFVSFIGSAELVIGHNFLGYDLPVLKSLLGIELPVEKVCDTLILSKLIDYSRGRHSIEDYGIEFGLPKGDFKDFSKYSQEMENYCVRDVDICERIYRKYYKYIANNAHTASIQLEHRFQLVVNALHDNGFSFNSDKATKLLDKVTAELAVLDKDILEAFPPKLTLIREITPKETKYGTLAKTDFRWLGDADISEYNGGPFCRCSWNDFNPNSHRQIVTVLQSAGWSPMDKTKSHIEVERELGRLRYDRSQGSDLDLRKKELTIRLEELRKTGWQVNENNIESLPDFEPLVLWKDKCRIKISKTDELTKSLIEQIIQKRFLKREKEVTQSTLGSVELRPSNTTIKIPDAIEVTSLKEITEFLQRISIEWHPNRKNFVEFVNKTNHLWSIIVTPQDVYVDCSASFVTDTWVGLRNTAQLQSLISKLKAARLLAKRILLESRRRTLTEWLALSTEQGRIHGKFYGIGAWTHRMAHQNPNTANIPNEFDLSGRKKLLGKELRALWCAPKNRLLVGVDAEGIQLRIFAHYINDPEFTEALVNGRKEDKTDPHSLNQRIIGDICKSRAAAKRFIFALLLGGGLGKLAEILQCSREEVEIALERILERYTGFAHLKQTIIPKDAERGWFTGLDGRRVRILGDTVSQRKHLAMSGYLQNGEKVVMASATVKFEPELKHYDAILVNLVHDEWQTECPNNMEIALNIARMQADSLRQVGEELKLNCPLAGSYWNDDYKDYTIHTNWSMTH